MNERIIRNLGIALLAILALYGLLRWQQSRTFEPVKPKEFNFKAITAKSTERIGIKDGGSSYNIVKSGKNWTLDSKKKASKTAMDELFNGLKEAEIEQLTATKKSKLAELQIDDESGKTVTFWTKDRKFTFMVGKQSLDGTNFYVRLPKEDKAYLASGNLGTIFAKKATDWTK